MTSTKIVFALMFAAAAIFTAAAFAQTPFTPNVVQASIDAYNAKDVAYFDKHLAPEVVWLDEDGHVISGKNSVMGFLRNQLTDPTARKLVATNIKVGNTTDAAWASFAYTIDHQGKEQHKGLNSTFFKKAGNDWMIVLVHGAFDAPGHH